MKKALLSLLVLVAGIVLYIRIAPSDPAEWHVDPRTAEDPGPEGILLTVDDPAKTYAVPPETLIAVFDKVAMAQPRVSRLAGSAAEGHVTYIARSKIMGYPDYISVMAVAADGGSRLAVLSRQRFGGADWGVNKARLDDWLTKLDAAFR